jgi:hypothetical protein
MANPKVLFLSVDDSVPSRMNVEEYPDRLRFAYVISDCRDAEETCPTVLLNSEKQKRWPFNDLAKNGGSYNQRLQSDRELRDLIAQRMSQWIETG